MYGQNVIDQKVEQIKEFYGPDGADYPPEIIEDFIEKLEFGTETTKGMLERKWLGRMNSATGGRDGYQVGGRVNLQFGNMDFPLAKAMNNNQEEKETDIHNIIADIYDVNEDTYVREEEPVSWRGRADKNMAPLKYLLEGMKPEEARAAAAADFGRQKEKYREEGWNVDTWGQGDMEEFGSNLYSMFHP